MVDLQFEGEMLCNVSTREPGQSRWTEIHIYKTNTGRWVTEVLGRSNVYHEHDIISAVVSNTPKELRDSLLRTKDGRTFMSDIAFEALEEAAKKDPEIETIESV